MFGSSFGGVLQAAKDIVEVKDCWGGEVITAWIMRADHPDWVAFEKPFKKPSPISSAITRGSTKSVVSSTLRFGDKVDLKAPERVEELVRAVNDEIDRADLSMESLASSDDLESLKPGIAMYLVKGWDMRDIDDVPVPCAPGAVLRALGWEGVHVQFEECPGKDRWVSKAEFAGYSNKHLVSKAIAKGEAQAIEYDGHQRNDEGEVLIVAKGLRYAGRPVGDALAAYWLSEARKHALEAQGEAEEDEKKSDASPDGEPESSAA